MSLTPAQDDKVQAIGKMYQWLKDRGTPFGKANPVEELRKYPDVIDRVFEMYEEVVTGALRRGEREKAGE